VTFAVDGAAGLDIAAGSVGFLAGAGGLGLGFAAALGGGVWTAGGVSETCAAAPAVHVAHSTIDSGRRIFISGAIPVRL
jgi:hypothetical protein